MFGLMRLAIASRLTSYAHAYCVLSSISWTYKPAHIYRLRMSVEMLRIARLKFNVM